MKRSILLFLVGAAVGGGIVWLAMHGREKAGEEKTSAEKSGEAEEQSTTVTHDTNGNVVIHMSDETQGDIGIVVSNPAPAQFAPELKAYGRVLDPAPWHNQATRLLNVAIALDNSGQELKRITILRAQTNASDKAVQMAEMTFRQNLNEGESIISEIRSAWGSRFADEMSKAIIPDAHGQNQFVRMSGTLGALGSFADALVRIDLPAGESLNTKPESARVVLTGEDRTVREAEFFDFAPSVDPQIQGRGLFFVLNSADRLPAGATLTAYLKVPGPPLAGVIVPRDAVVRTQGKGWIYVLNRDGESFTRKEVPLERAVESGWFVMNSVTPDSHVVVVGAQTLLSEELKAGMSGD